MTDGITTVAGIKIPSVDPVFLSIVALHVLLGLVSVTTGAAAMLSRKAPGRHPTFGTTYFWSVFAVFVSATALSFMRWSEDAHLFILGTLSFIAAYAGRTVHRLRPPGWARIHIAAMGVSYVVLVTAFYVDNGKQLPLWRELPVWTYWAVPALVGVPFIIWALLKHPVARQQAEEEVPPTIPG